jgi:hypothetical protein
VPVQLCQLCPSAAPATDKVYADDPGLYVTRHCKIESGRLVLLEDYESDPQMFASAPVRLAG